MVSSRDAPRNFARGVLRRDPAASDPAVAPPFKPGSRNGRYSSADPLGRDLSRADVSAGNSGGVWPLARARDPCVGASDCGLSLCGLRALACSGCSDFALVAGHSPHPTGEQHAAGLGSWVAYCLRRASPDRGSDAFRKAPRPGPEATFGDGRLSGDPQPVRRGLDAAATCGCSADDCDFSPWTPAERVAGILRATGAGILWEDAESGIALLRMEPAQRWSLWRQGALFVSGAGLPEGCFGWSTTG